MHPAFILADAFSRGHHVFKALLASRLRIKARQLLLNLVCLFLFSMDWARTTTTRKPRISAEALARREAENAREHAKASKRKLTIRRKSL